MEKTEEINWREYIIWHDYCSKKCKNDINMRQEERFLNIAVLMGVFFVLLFLGVPIAYSLCLSAVLYMALFMDVPMIIIGQQMLKGVDSFTLMAIPFL